MNNKIFKNKSFTDDALMKSINVRVEKAKERWIGKQKDLGGGNTATITDYRANNDIDVLLSNGKTINTSIHSFNNSKFKSYFDNPYTEPRNNHLGESKMMNCGYIATIIKSDTILDISVQFNDKEKTIVEHREYSSFIDGSINCPTAKESPQERAAKIVKDRYAKNMVGYKFYIDKYDIDAEVIEYNGCSNVIVRFADGVEKKCNARAVKANYVRRDDLEGIAMKRKNREKWIGKTFELNEGYVAKVIDYEDSEHVTIEIDGNTYMSQIRTLNKKAIPKELKYKTICEPGKIYKSIYGIPFKILNMENNSENNLYEVLMLTGDVIKYNSTKTINDKRVGGRISKNERVAGFVIDKIERFDNERYYMCSCSNCEAKGLLTPIEMIQHAEKKHGFKPAFEYSEG